MKNQSTIKPYDQHCLDRFISEYKQYGIFCRVTDHVIDVITKSDPICFHMRFEECHDCLDNGLSGCEQCIDALWGYGRIGYVLNSEPNEPTVLDCKDKMMNEI